MSIETKKETTIAEKLDALRELQMIDSQIDKVRIIRGELPLEVQDLEDEIQGLETRISKIETDIKDEETEISNRKNASKDAELLIAKYKEQQENVRNNREYESLAKEIEYHELEIKLNEKRAKESRVKIAQKKDALKETQERLAYRKEDLKLKQSELNEIVAETQKEEDTLLKDSEKAKSKIEQRLLSAYVRLRQNAENGLAVVPIERNSCGGCFNKIPPQRQLDIEMKKKVIVCEHCGRILIPAQKQEE